MAENEIGREVVDSAVMVHRELGPGLLETVSEVVLARELEGRDLSVERQAKVPVCYRGIRFLEGFRADLIVEEAVLVELKPVGQLTPVPRKQLLPCLRLKELKLGVLLNFGACLMRDGIARVVCGLEEGGEQGAARGSQAKTPRRDDGWV